MIHKKKKIHIILSYGLILFVFLVLFKLIADNWVAIKSAEYNFNFWLLFPAVFFGLLNHVWAAWLWQAILKRLDSSVNFYFVDYYPIFVKSWLGRYLPGKVWMSAGKVYLGVRQGIKKKPLALSAFFELALSSLGHLLAALFFSLLIFRGLVANSTVYFISAFMVLALAILVMHPKFLHWAFTLFVKKFRKDLFTPSDFLAYRFLAVFSLGYAGQAVMVGLSAAFLYLAIFGFSWSSGLFVLGGFTVSNFLARISLLTPAGLGVREGLLTALLSLSFALPVATLFTVLTRFFMIILDICALALSYVLTKLMIK
jgi:uncharacterized membrane protein YbhN (UPF0104 family)